MIGLLSLVTASLLGYCAVRLWLPAEHTASRWMPVLHATLGTGLGLGVTGCLYWLLVLMGAGTLPVVAVVELVMLASLGAFVVRQRSTSAPAPEAASSPVFPSWIPGLGLAGMLGLFTAALFGVSELSPQGGWDAFSVWNLRARFLLHTETWKYAVTRFPVGTHMEYPLLLSSVVARGWLYAGSPAPEVPIGTAMVFGLALVMLLTSTLAVSRGSSIGLLAGAILLANPSLIDQASSQYADVPLAFYFLAALSLTVLGSESPRPARWLSLAGAFAGFAAWTKNEGVMLLFALGIGLFVNAWRSAGWRPAARQVASFLLGAAPVLCLVLWFKLALAPPDPLADQMAGGLGQKLVTGARWLQVTGGFLKQAWTLYIFPGPALAVLAVTCGLLRLRPRQERSVLPGLAVLLSLAGYFAIFLVTNYDLEWLIGSALERLYLHLWPALVLAVFLMLRRPEDFAIVTAPVKVKKGR